MQEGYKVHNSCEGLEICEIPGYQEMYQTFRSLTKKVADIYLLTTPSEVVDVQLSKPFQGNHRGMTWLHIVCFEGFEDTVHAFIDRDNCKKYINALDGNGFTPLKVACVRGFYYIAMILLERGAIVDYFCYENIKSYLYEMKQKLYNMRVYAENTRYGYHHSRNIFREIYFTQMNYNRLTRALQESQKKFV